MSCIHCRCRCGPTLVEINRTLDETLARQEGDLDPDTRFCVA